MRFLKDRLVRNILLCILGLGFLGGAYYLVLKIPESTEEPVAEETSAPSSQSIELIKIKLDEVSSLYVKNPEDEYKVVKNGEGWGVEGRNIVYSKTKTENHLYDFINLNATKEVTGVASDDEYGLTNPTATFTVKKTDGAEYTVNLGNKVIGDSGYFAKMGDKVYVIASYKGESILKTANDLRDKDMMTVDQTTLKRFKISNPSGVVADIRPANEDEADKFSMLTSLVMTEPKYVAVSADSFNKIISSVLSVSANEFISDSRGDFGKYGLDTPKLTFEIADESGSYVINYGNKAENGDVYANMEGSDSIFTQSPAMFDALAKVDTLSMIEKFCHIINIDAITGVTVSGEGKNFSLTLEGEEDNMKYFCGGNTANEKAFKRAYQEVIGLISNGFAEKQVSGEPEYTIIFSYKDGSTLNCNYISYDERNYVLDRNGVREYIILKKNLSAMIERLEEFAADPGKEPE